MNFLIIEQPVNNRGDESAHRGFVNSLADAFPNSNIRVLFFEKLDIEVNEMRVNRKNVEYINIPTRHKLFAPHRMIKLFMMLNLGWLLNILPIIRKIKKIYAQSDYIICAPGGIDMGGFQNWVHIALLDIAKRMNKKIIYFARSIGPFPTGSMFSRLFKKKSIELLSYFDYISLRDAKSQKLAQKLGINVVKTIDSAFLYYTPEEAPQSFKEQIGNSKYIVFVPNSLAWHHDFNAYSYNDFYLFWVELTNRLLNEYRDYKIAMLPQTTSYGVFSTLPDGYKFFCKIKDGCNSPDRIVVLEEQYGSNIQQNIISKSELLIGARYHSIIFSINQAIPFVSLCYEHKMKGVTEMLGKEDIDIQALFNGDSITPEEREKFINMIIGLCHTAKADANAQKEARIIAKNGFTQLVEHINK